MKPDFAVKQPTHHTKSPHPKDSLLQRLCQRSQKMDQGLGVRTIVESEPDEDTESGVPLPDLPLESLLPTKGGVWMTVESDADEDVGVKVPLDEVLPESGVRVADGVQIPLDEGVEDVDGVRIPSDEDELAAGVSKGFNEDELADGVLIAPDELPDVDAADPPAPNPPLLIPLTEHHSMYSS
jgi:hypothetical protein